MKIVIDCSNLETANNEAEATSYYGGYIRVASVGPEGEKGILVNGIGTDRDFNLYWAVREAIETILGRPLTEEEVEELDGHEALDGWTGCTLEFPGGTLVPDEDPGLDTVVMKVTVKREDAVKVLDALRFAVSEPWLALSVCESERRPAFQNEIARFKELHQDQ